MGKIIAIANQKGGVGKTTTTINLGASLVNEGFRVLLSDMDPQGNATSGVGVVCGNDEPSLYEVLIGEIPVKDAIYNTDIDGLFLLPGRIDLTAAEIELVPIQEREQLLKRQLESIKSSYDYILIDCPPSLGLLTVNALTAASSVLIPLQCEYYAMEGLGQLMNTIRLIRESLNPNLQLEGILLTMYDQRNNLSKEVVRQINEYFEKEAFKTIIPRSVRLSEAPSYGQPISVYDRYSIGSLRYQELAIELINRNMRLG